jgi:hypothetical protein
MLIVHSRNGVPVRLTAKRWQHIRQRHPDMAGQREQVIETLAEPEVIQEGDFGTLLAVRMYLHTPLTRKFLVVVYREVTSEDGFVVTAYFASQLSVRRTVLWTR